MDSKHHGHAAGHVVARRQPPLRVLLTGFEPFGGERVNPSQRVVDALAGAGIQGLDLHTVVLPVDRARAAEDLLARVDALAPDTVVLLGEAGGRERITPERVAINVDDYGIADNAGNQPRDEGIVPGGPVGYFSSLPIRSMVARMEAAGVPAGISNSAGTYLCNHVFYRLMHHIAVRGATMRGGFLHLPYLHEQVRGKPGAPPGFAPDTLVRAVRCCLEATMETPFGGR